MSAVVRLLSVAATAALLTGCGADRPALPSGDPLEIVGKAADTTARLAHATVSVTDPATNLEAMVTPVRPGHGRADRYATAALQVLHAAVDVDPFGGQAIRGVSTMRYSVTADAAVARAALGPGAPLGDLGPKTFELDVWIDAGYRVRRVQLATVPGATPPPTARGGVPALLTVDFLAFPGGDPAAE